jgi:hypothetical protein
MAEPKRHATKQYRLGSYVLGTGAFTANKWLDISLQNLPEYILPGNKAIVTEIEMKVSLTATTLANDQALAGMFLHYLVDWEFYGPGGQRFRQRKGWHDYLWNALQDGRVLGLRAAALPTTGGSPGSYARTFSKHMRFTEDVLSSRYAACIPSIALAKSGGKLRVFVHNSAEGVRPGGAGPLGLGCSAAQLDIFVHLLDVPATDVPVPVFLEEMSIDGILDLNPGPDIGDYLRVAIANGPAFGATQWDDLSAYTNIDYFGVAGNYRIIDSPVDLWYREFHKQVTDEVESHQLVDPIPATQKAEYRLLDPSENSDGKLRALPLIYPRKGSDISESARYRGAKPTAKFNNNVRTGLPASIDFLVHRVQPRDDKMTAAIVSALSPNAIHKELRVPAGYRVGGTGPVKPGIDTRRIPLIADAST